MNLDKPTMKKLGLLVAFGVALSWLLNNFEAMGGILRTVWGLVFPFILGFGIAFILNLPMRAIEKHLFRGRGGRLRRPVSFVLALVLVLAVVVLVVVLVLPALIDTLWQLGSAMPGYIRNAQQTLRPYAEYVPQLEQWLADLNIDWRNWVAQLTDLLQSGAGNFFSGLVGMATSIVNGFVSLFVGFVFACYLLLDKEHLSAQLQGVLRAYLPDKAYKRTSYVGGLFARTYSGFIAGQCTEAVIVTCLYMLVLSIGRFEYWPLISVLIGFCSLIPMIGAFVGCIISVLLLLVSMGFWRALIFVIIFFTVQNIEGNLIYPHVVGGRVGLPAVWTLVAVMVGGGLMGIIGMLLFIPLFSVLYTLLHRSARARLAKKGIPSPVAALEKPAKKPRKKGGKMPQNTNGTDSPEDTGPGEAN